MPQPKKANAKSPATVNAYIAAAPEDRRRGLAQLRKTIKAAAPAATESVSYGIAGFKYKGKPLVYFGYWKEHLALYGLGSSVIKEHAAELKPYDVEKGTIRLAAGVAAPARLVRTLVKARLAELDKPFVTTRVKRVTRRT
ncbi:MAG: DUF1801 domain-containing protein [Chloroflexota bacterium]|nr:DUF1801 domain-containing protein [Chloroflexota bacterium]